jgi:hypothetical protein
MSDSIHKLYYQTQCVTLPMLGAKSDLAARRLSQQPDAVRRALDQRGTVRRATQFRRDPRHGMRRFITSLSVVGSEGDIIYNSSTISSY